MEIFVENDSKKLVQVTDGNEGVAIGLYLIPVDVSYDDFENEFEKAESQDEFDENNSLSAQRVYAYDSIVFPKNF